MGMFDNVEVEYPLPDEAARHVGEWQTKDLDCWMDVYRLTAEGRLMEEVYHTEDRSDKSAPPGSLASVRGIWSKVHEDWKDMNYHGVLNFYGHTTHGREWVEYNATFTNGQLVSSEVATSVLSYWDYMDAVPGDDERPAAEFKDEMDRRMDRLRMALDIPESPAVENR